jgi:hypothetical protein
MHVRPGGWKSISPDNDTTVESRALDLVSQLEAAATVDDLATGSRLRGLRRALGTEFVNATDWAAT